MADKKTALAGLDWLSGLGVSAAHINNARTALQSKATPQTDAGPIPASILAQPQATKQAPSHNRTRDEILAMAAEAKRRVDEVAEEYGEQRNAIASTQAITGLVDDIGPQIDAARKDVHKLAADAKHSANTGNLAAAAKAAADASDQAKKAGQLKQAWESALGDKLAYSKTVTIATSWGEIRHLEDQSKMVNSMAVGLMRSSEEEKTSKVRVADKLNEIEDATKPMGALLKNPGSAGALVAAATADNPKMQRATSDAELARLADKISEVRATLATIMSDQVATADAQYSAAQNLLEAQRDDDAAAKILKDFEDHKARWDLLKASIKNLAELVASGGEAVINVVKDEAKELFTYFREKGIKEQAEELSNQAGKLRNGAFTAIMAKAADTVGKLGIELQKLMDQIDKDNEEAVRLVKAATKEFDAHCGACKVKFKDIEGAMALVQAARALAVERRRILEGMAKSLEQIRKELKMSRTDRPEGRFYEDNNGLVFTSIHTDVIHRQDNAQRQSSQIDALMPPLATLFKSAFSALKV